MTAICLNSHREVFALTARDLAAMPVIGSPRVLAGADLLEAIPIEAMLTLPRDRPQAADMTLGSDDSVFRSRSNGTRIQGVLVASHGLVVLQASGKRVHVSGLLEIRFDAGESAYPYPELQQGDLGRLVCLASGAACGVLVAGSEHIGYAVPLREALARLDLSLAVLPIVVSELAESLALGAEAMRSESIRDLEVDLGNPPMGLAA